jgi:hypothetical protein
VSKYGKTKGEHLKMTSIHFVGPYSPVMCGIADYTTYLTRIGPSGQWAVVSFDLERYGWPMAAGRVAPSDRVWFGIPGRDSYSAGDIRDGLRRMGVHNDGSVLWFQHEFGIWPHNFQFVAMLKALDMPKIVTLHTLHFQSPETECGLRSEQHRFLRLLLPHVDAITVFTHGVRQAVASAFPEYEDKVHVIKHGVHSYPEVSSLTREEARERLDDYLLFDSGLDRNTKELLHRQRILTDPNTVVVGQTGFFSPSKGSGVLFAVRDGLQESIPQKRIAAVRIGRSIDGPQRAHAERLRASQAGKCGFVVDIWLPQDMLPLAQRAFDTNVYWPDECTQSGVLAHALGAGATIAGRDLEGVGETLRESGQPVDVSLARLLAKIRSVVTNPELREMIKLKTLEYATELSWENQARQHHQVAETVWAQAAAGEEQRLPLPLDIPTVVASSVLETR